MRSILLLTILSIQVLALATHKIEPINSSAGLFYKNLGNAKISNQKFSLVLFYNLTLLDNQLELVKYHYTKAVSLCHITDEENYNVFYCTNQIKLIHNTLIKIQNKIDILEKHTRQKRGLINGISYGLKWLFGTPDADDAMFYSDSINSLIDDQKQTHTLMQQQIRIISSTIQNFNNTLMNLKNNEYILNSNLEQFNNFSKITTNLINKERHGVQIVEHITLLSNIANELLLQIEKYLLDLALIRHGIIDYNTVNPQTLYDELKLISYKYSLPIPLSPENIERYYKIIDIKAFLQDKNLVIKLNIPISSINEYDLFQVYPLPTPHSNNSFIFSYIQPENPYILLSKPRTQYAMLKTLEKCEEVYNLQWLCKSISIFHKNDQHNCEIQLFSKITKNIPSSCQIKTMHADIEIWQNINPTQWLFVTSKPTALNILCYNGKTPDHEEIIDKMGILTLNSNCKAYTDTNTLEPETLLNNKSTTIKIPITDITQDDCCIKHEINTTLNTLHLQPIKFAHMDLNELKFAQHRLQQFDDILQEQLSKPFIIKHSSWFTTAISITTGIILLTILYNVSKWCGLFKLASNILCCTKAPRNNQSSPCIKIFNQCYSSKEDQPQTTLYNVKYNASDEQLVSAPPVSNPPPYYVTNKISSRRSTSSSDQIRPHKKTHPTLNNDLD